MLCPVNGPKISGPTLKISGFFAGLGVGINSWFVLILALGSKQDFVPVTSKDLKFHGCMTLLNSILMFLMLSMVW